MTEKQNGQAVPNRQDGNQSKDGQSNQKKDGTPSEKTAAKEDGKIKPETAEDSKEQEPRKHPHEVLIPVVTQNENKSSI